MEEYHSGGDENQPKERVEDNHQEQEQPKQQVPPQHELNGQELKPVAATAEPSKGQC
jgi:hypothetical protein